MQTFSISPSAIPASYFRNYGLIKELTKREVVGRYRGSFAGILWSVFTPLFMLTVYTFIFNVAFKARWKPDSESTAEFALIMFVGLTVFNFFAESISRAPGLILANANYVKKVVFPLEILPLVNIGSALFHALISFGVWIIAYAFIVGLPKPSILMLPLVVVPLVLLTLGISWFLAALGVYLRDVSQVVTVAITALMFFSPVFYPVSAIPQPYSYLLFINPLTFIIEQTRTIMILGAAPDFVGLGGYFVVAMTVAWLGFVWFQKTRKGFADVI